MVIPGPGKLFVIPDERHKIRPSGIALPTIAQDDPDHGTVVAMGAPAWLGEVEGEAGLVYGGGAGWSPVLQRAPCQVGDVIAYDCENVIILPMGWSEKDGKLYVLDQAHVLGVYTNTNEGGA